MNDIAALLNNFGPTVAVGVVLVAILAPSWKRGGAEAKKTDANSIADHIINEIKAKVDILWGERGDK